MAANISRDTDQPQQHYDKVILQQGVPFPDADFNEAQDIMRRKVRTLTEDSVGNGSPDDGFKIVGTGATNDFTIKAGHIYVSGYLVILEGDATYSSQPDFGAPPALSEPSGTDRTDEVYLEVFEDEIDSTEDTFILDPDIAIETSQRVRIRGQVKVAVGTTTPADGGGFFRFKLATLNRVDGQAIILSGDVIDTRGILTGKFVETQGDDMTGPLVITSALGTLLTLTGSADTQLLIQGTATARIFMSDTGASSNNKSFLLLCDDGAFTLRALNDNGTTKGDRLVISTAGNVSIQGSLSASPTSNQLVLGTTRTITISATQPAVASRTYTIPDAGADANFIMSQSSQTIAGALTLQSALTITASSGNTLVINTTDLVVDSSNHRLGLGTASPTKRLDVVGDINYSGNLYSGGTLGILTADIRDGQVTLPKIASGILNGYRRPNIVYASISTVDLEAQTGTANQSSIRFPDGALVSVTENLASTQKYRRWDITKTAEFTSGTESGGLRSGLSEASLTWYAIYAVRSQIDNTKFVLVGDTTLPLAANLSTLDGRYATNGWVYLGMVRNGNKYDISTSGGSHVWGTTIEADLIGFVQDGNHFRFMAYGTTLIGNTSGGAGTAKTVEGGMFLGSGEPTTSIQSVTLWTYSAGVGATDIPDHLTLVDLRINVYENGSTAFGIVYFNGVSDPLTPHANAQTNALLQDTIAVLSVDGDLSERNAIMLSYYLQLEQTFKDRLSIKGPHQNSQRTSTLEVIGWPAADGMACFANTDASTNFVANLTGGVILKGWEDPVLARGLNNLF